MALGTQQNATTVSAGTGERSYRGPLAMVTTLFFMWGFLTCLNDILVPHLKSIFDLNYAEVMLIQFCFFSAYFVFSVPSGKIIERIGYQKMMVAGLLIMGLGALLFIPAASAPSFPLFLAALIILAAGITALQVAANPYVAVLGPARTASSRLNLTQAFNSLGTTVAPYFGGLLILGAAAAPKSGPELLTMSPAALHAYRLQEASSVKLPYLVIAIALIVLGVVIGKFHLPHIPEAEGGHAVAHDSVRHHRNLLLGTVAIFTYVGAEVAIGSFLVNYMNLPEIGNLRADIAAKYLSFYWGGAMCGRFIGSAVLQKVPTRIVLGFNAIVAAALVCLSMSSFGQAAMWALLAVGFFNSIMFPSIFTLGIEGLGPLTGEASGLLVMAIVGGAVIPELQGVLADHIGLHHAFVLPALCYLYILFFAMKGQPRRRAERV
ncbi:MAG TPA: sugar MFS transporter [Candidatus Binatia bacterium]|nr:sugar MFS transporter [Candidatus Binatia bacterium]